MLGAGILRRIRTHSLLNQVVSFDHQHSTLLMMAAQLMMAAPLMMAALLVAAARSSFDACSRVLHSTTSTHVQAACHLKSYLLSLVPFVPVAVQNAAVCAKLRVTDCADVY